MDNIKKVNWAYKLMAASFVVVAIPSFLLFLLFIFILLKFASANKFAGVDLSRLTPTDAIVLVLPIVLFIVFIYTARNLRTFKKGAFFGCLVINLCILGFSLLIVLSGLYSYFVTTLLSIFGLVSLASLVFVLSSWREFFKPQTSGQDMVQG